MLFDPFGLKQNNRVDQICLCPKPEFGTDKTILEEYDVLRHWKIAGVAMTGLYNIKCACPLPAGSSATIQQPSGLYRHGNLTTKARFGGRSRKLCFKKLTERPVSVQASLHRAVLTTVAEAEAAVAAGVKRRINLLLPRIRAKYSCYLDGRVAEWLKAPDSKSGVGVSLPEVRILSLPPASARPGPLFLFVLDVQLVQPAIGYKNESQGDEDHRSIVDGRSSGLPLRVSACNYAYALAIKMRM